MKKPLVLILALTLAFALPAFAVSAEDPAVTTTAATTAGDVTTSTEEALTTTLPEDGVVTIEEIVGDPDPEETPVVLDDDILVTTAAVPFDGKTTLAIAIGVLWLAIGVVTAWNLIPWRKAKRP